jgi:putative addiction module component (TIGR02574 family)
MASTTQAIFEQALSLPVRKREELAEKLWRSLDKNTQEEHQQAWLIEINRRIEELHPGRVKATPGKKVLQAIRNDLFKK